MTSEQELAHTLARVIQDFIVATVFAQNIFGDDHPDITIREVVNALAILNTKLSGVIKRHAEMSLVN